MGVIRAAARPTKAGPAERFTGEAWLDEVVVGTAIGSDARVFVASIQRSVSGVSLVLSQA